MFTVTQDYHNVGPRTRNRFYFFKAIMLIFFTYDIKLLLCNSKIKDLMYLLQ